MLFFMEMLDKLLPIRRQVNSTNQWWVNNELMSLNESPAEQNAAWYQPSDTPLVPFSPQGGQNHITSWLCRPASETRHA